MKGIVFLSILVFPIFLNAWPFGWGGWNGWGGGSGTTIVVDSEPDSGFFSSHKSCEGGRYKDTIQEAVDIANEGDTISICDGTYDESVDVDKNKLTIKKSDDADGDVIVKNSDTIFTLDGVNGIIIDGLELNSSDKYGIEIKGYSNDLYFQNLNIESSGDGIASEDDIGDFALMNSTILSHTDDGVDVNKDVKNVVIDDVQVQASDNAMKFDKGVNGDMNISKLNATNVADGIEFNTIAGELNILDTNITATNFAILVKKSPNDDVNISNNILKVNTDKHAIEFKNNINANLSISNTDIDSGGYTLVVGGNVNQVTLSYLNLLSNNNNGIEFEGAINNGLTFEHSTIKASSSGQYGLLFEGELNKGVDIKDVNISADNYGIHFKNKINDGITIDSCEINSSSSMGIKFMKEIYNNLKINNVEINAYERGIYFNEKQANPVITNSKIVSQTYDAIYTKNNNWSKFTLKDSCLKSKSDNRYALWINNTSTNAEVKNNCFYAPEIDRLGKAGANGNDVDGNYWDGNSGNYVLNKISDTNTLTDCSLSCAMVSANTQSTNGTSNSKFDAWNADSSHSLTDRNITTKISSKDFNIIIASLNEDNDDYQEFNGTVCSRVDGEEWFKNYFQDKNTSDQTDEGNPKFNITKAIKDTNIDIHWKKDVNVSCPLTNEDNSTSSSDNFAIRPKDFHIEDVANLSASDEFDLNVTARDDGGSATAEYNTTLNNIYVNISDTSKTCSDNDADINITSVDFSDGQSSTSAKFDNVGVVDINITDKVWASVDDDDTPKDCNGLYICSNTTQISIYPAKFAIEFKNPPTMKNNNTNDNFTYLSNDLNMSAWLKNLDINITALNGDDDTVTNFDKECYEDSIEFDFDLTKPKDDKSNDANLTYNSDDNDKNTTLGFEKGVVDINHSDFGFNFTRLFYEPRDPFLVDGNDSNITINIVDNNHTDAKGTITKKFEDNATFYYGRVMTQDVETTKDINTTVDVEVYDSSSSSFVSGFVQKSLKWYRHKNHNDKQDGYIQEINATNGVKLEDEEFSLTYGTQVHDPSNGIISVDINKASQEKTYTMHIKTQPWLWYIPDDYGDEYDYSDGSNCTTHPCFKYTLKKTQTSSKIKSGDFNGTSYDIEDRGDYKRVGIKVFR
jgi:hypothetical protein